MKQLDNARRVLKTFSSHLGEQADATYADTINNIVEHFKLRRQKTEKYHGAALRRRISHAREHRIDVESTTNRYWTKIWKNIENLERNIIYCITTAINKYKYHDIEI